MSDIRWNGQNEAGEFGSAGKAELADIICTLLDSGERSRLLELHYWSEEPQLLDIMRILAGLPDEARQGLHDFLTRVADPEEIKGTAAQSGQFTLSAPLRCAAVLPFRKRRKSLGTK